jgi:hypothetical protein
LKRFYGQILEVFQAGSNYELSGTYAHPLLVPHIASWISPSFADKVPSRSQIALEEDGQAEREAGLPNRTARHPEQEAGRPIQRISHIKSH